MAAPYVASFVVGAALRASNAKAKAELGWRPAFATYVEGIRAMASPTQTGQQVSLRPGTQED
jgi:nucleoside-diphosphate-sugar epimerase